MQLCVICRLVKDVLSPTGCVPLVMTKVFSSACHIVPWGTALVHLSLIFTWTKLAVTNTVSETMLAITNYLFVFQHHFQEDLLHDLVWCRDCPACNTLDLPFSPFSKWGLFFFHFQLLRTSLEWPSFSNTLHSYSASSSTSFLRTLECISSDPK